MFYNFWRKDLSFRHYRIRNLWNISSDSDQSYERFITECLDVIVLIIRDIPLWGWHSFRFNTIGYSLMQWWVSTIKDSNKQLATVLKLSSRTLWIGLSQYSLFLCLTLTVWHSHGVCWFFLKISWWKRMSSEHSPVCVFGKTQQACK